MLITPQILQLEGYLDRITKGRSRQLTKSEKNYSNVEWEVLAAVSAIKEFYPYHRPQSMKELKDVGGCLARWLHLQQLTFKVENRAGKNHGNGDGISRRPPTE